MQLRKKNEKIKIGNSDICIPSIINNLYKPFIIVPGQNVRNQHNLVVMSCIFQDDKNNAAFYGYWTCNGVITDQGIFNPQYPIEDIDSLLPTIEAAINQPDVEFGDMINAEWIRNFLNTYREPKWKYIDQEGAVIFDEERKKFFILGKAVHNQQLFNRNETIFAPDKLRTDILYKGYLIATVSLYNDTNIQIFPLALSIDERNIKLVSNSNDTEEVKKAKALAEYYKYQYQILQSFQQVQEKNSDSRLQELFEYVAKSIKGTLHRSGDRAVKKIQPFMYATADWDEVIQYMKQNGVKNSRESTRAVPKLVLNFDQACAIIGGDNLENIQDNYKYRADLLTVNYRISSNKMSWTWKVKEYPIPDLEINRPRKKCCCRCNCANE